MSDLTHASFFSGIGAFDLGLERAGFRVVSHAEVKPFSCAVLETHWPGVPNLGDINAICPTGEGDHECEIPPATVWSGGFPCSDFSIMGLRKGLLGGNRSSLGLVFLDLVRRHRPPFVVLENVPGLLSSHEGRDLALLLSVLEDIGYGWAFRLLDARHFGLPQARRRLFIVAAADAERAGAVLDDVTDRGVDAASFGGPSGAALAGGRDGADQRPAVVIGPTYAPRSDAIVRTDGTTFPITPGNLQYVLDEPITIQRRGFSGADVRRDGTAYTLLPDDAGRQYVTEPIVIERHGHFEPQVKRDGTAYTILPVGAGGNIGQQYVVDRGPGPTVLAGVFPKRREQRSPSRADGSSYTLTPGVIPYVVEPGDWDDLPDVRGDGGLGGDRDGAGAGAGLRALAPAEDHRPAPDGDDPAGTGPAPDADGVRAAAGLPGWLDDPVGDGVDPVGPQHLDTARWHVLGRACPVPVVEWIALGIRAVINGDEVSGEDADAAGT
jgi:site-specific DNA-cytosine methylase